MTYQDIGPRALTATNGLPADSRFAGLWVCAFTPTVLATSLTDFECYHMAIQNGPAGAGLTVYRNSDYWGATQLGTLNEWDPEQPLPVHGGDTVYLVWSAGKATAPTAPTATIWLRTQAT